MSVTPIEADSAADTDMLVLLKQFPVFCQLPETVLSRLAAHTQDYAVEAGTVLFAAGQYEADDIYCCVSGEARLIVTGADGAIRRRDITAGMVTGLDCVLAGTPAAALFYGLQATGAARFVLVHADALREAVSASHQACLILLREMARQRLDDQGTAGGAGREALARLCGALVSLAENGGSEDAADWRIASMPRHRELAALADTEEKTAAEAIARLISTGVLKRDYPGMKIMDHAGLMALAE